MLASVSTHTRAEIVRDPNGFEFTLPGWSRARGRLCFALERTPMAPIIGTKFARNVMRPNRSCVNGHAFSCYDITRAPRKSPEFGHHSQRPIFASQCGFGHSATLASQQWAESSVATQIVELAPASRDHSHANVAAVASP